jgi:hypothetical protein
MKIGAVVAIGGLLLALAGGVVAVEDRYTTKSEFAQLVDGVKELAGSVKEFRLESRLESLQAERRQYLIRHGGSWCEKVPVRCQALLDRISATEDKLQAARRK